MLHAAAGLIFSARKSEHIGPLLCELHWLRVPERIRFLLCVLAFRCLHGTAQSYLVGSLRRAADVDGRRHLRSANTVSLVVPQPSARHSATAPFLWLQPEHATTFRQRSWPHCRFWRFASNLKYSFFKKTFYWLNDRSQWTELCKVPLQRC